MYVTTKGLILRETRYKDSSKILTVLTPDEGKITVSARGALRKGSKLAAGTQVLAYSDMTLTHSRERWILSEAQSIELFLGLREDLGRLSLAAYFAELAEAVSDEDSVNPELLPLCLNALHALAGGKKETALIKAAFELRLMALAGFAPLLKGCSVCGNANAELLDIVGGTLLCLDCAAETRGLSRLAPGAREAAQYIAGCELKRLLSFKLGSEAMHNLSEIAEEYLLAQLDRRFSALEFYKSIEERL